MKINRIILLLLAVVAALAVIGCAKKESSVAGGILRIGNDPTYPPFEMTSHTSGLPEGFSIDLAGEICRINGWTPEFVATPFDGMIAGLNNGKYDIIISSMTITPERGEVVDFSEPYYLAGQSIAVPITDTMIKSIADLTGKKVGVQLGTTGEMMAKGLEGVNVISFENIGAAFLDLENGNIDAVLNDLPTSAAHIKAHGSAKFVGEVLSTEYYGIAVKKGNTEILDKINFGLRQAKSNGFYSQIHLKWFGAEADIAKLTSAKQLYDQ
jgi:ABC-type amino acid transport substrate-binding protein